MKGNEIMSRKKKNIIFSILICILVLINVLTIILVSKDNVKMMGDGFVNDMPNDMKEMPDDMMDKPDDMENRPNDMEDIPGDMKEENNNMENIPNMPKDMNNMPNMNKIDIKYYILFIIYSIILSMLITYLLMSKFNKKDFKETFTTNDKKIIYVLCVIILTSALTLIDTYITKNINSDFRNDNMFNFDDSNISYSGVFEINEESNISDKEYTSVNTDENVILVSGENNVTIENVTIEKTGDSNSKDNASFYGINSAIMAKDGTSLTLKNLNINTNGNGANGVFSYGGYADTENEKSDNTVINMYDSIITTKKDNSGGIMTTGGGTFNAYNLTINTSGVSSAAIRSDRGGGIVNVEKGNYTTNGSGSPAVYSTADISVKDATLTANASEGIVIEGKNSVKLDNVNLVSDNTLLNGLSTTYKNIFLYQSMSGDASVGNSLFTAQNSSITTNNGDSFYVTNTIATIKLTNNTIINNDSNGNFLRIQKDSWGNKNENGGDVTLILSSQSVNGNIVVDDISTLDISLSDNSYFEGSVNLDNTAKNISLSLDKTSTIKLTSDSYVSSLNNEINDNSNINFNGYKLYVNGASIN